MKDNEQPPLSVELDDSTIRCYIPTHDEGDIKITRFPGGDMILGKSYGNDIYLGAQQVDGIRAAFEKIDELAPEVDG